MSKIWTMEIRLVLYRRLVEQFGAIDKWKETSSPGGDRNKEFDQFCEDFARVVGAKSGDAVKHQIRFAMPESVRGSGSIWKNGGHAPVAILNKAAALEAGFIEGKHLPDLYACPSPR
jgi:hypothetical protein